MKTENGIPRRNQVDLNTPAELSIRRAIEAVEAAGAHCLITDAVTLLENAREKVADFVELPKIEVFELHPDTGVRQPNLRFLNFFIRGNDSGNEAFRALLDRAPTVVECAFVRNESACYVEQIGVDTWRGRCVYRLDKLARRGRCCSSLATCCPG